MGTTAIQLDLPTALMLAVAGTSSRSSLPSCEGEYVVPAAYDPAVTSRAAAGELLQTELRV